MCKVLSIVLAGGQGTRLRPLTLKQAKPALPFVGHRRIIDFVLSNLWHSGLHQVMVLAQYQAASLINYLQQGWQQRFSTDGFLNCITAPAQLNQGTAGAVAAQLSLIRDYRPDVIAILSADHIYKMDYRQMLAFHLAQQTDVSIAAVQVPLTLAHQFGILKADAALRICQFSEKPSAKTAQGFTQHNSVLASMGNYLFSAQALYQILDPLQAGEACDFGHDIIPALVAQGRASAYPFHHNSLPTKQSLDGYWRDVGTLAALFHSKLDVMQHEDWLDSPSQPWPILAGCSKPSLCNKTLRQIKKVCQPAVPLYASLQ